MNDCEKRLLSVYVIIHSKLPQFQKQLFYSLAEGYSISDSETGGTEIKSKNIVEKNGTKKSPGLAPFGYSSFLSILKNCLHYKSDPYLRQAV